MKRTILAAVVAALSFFGWAGDLRTVEIDSIAPSKGSVTAAISYGAGTAGQLYACYGLSSGGDSTNGWEYVEKVCDIGAEAGTANWTLASGWGTTACALRFFVLSAVYDKRFDYLASTGTQYIDTGYRLKAGMELTLEWAQHSTPSGEDKGWGVGTNVNTDNVTGGGRHRNIGIVPWMFGADRQFSPTALAKSDVTIGDWYLDRVTTTNGVVRYEMTHESDGYFREITPVNLPSANYVSGNNIFIYRDAANTSNMGHKRVRSFTLSDLANDTVLLDLVPCEKDGVACFYNRANGEFLYSGKDTFVTGPELPLSVEVLGSTECFSYQPPAPLGVEKPTCASSAFGSSVVAAQVTGIGKTAASATLTFAYGTTPDCADGTVQVPVTDAGSWSGTLPHLIAGQTYYVKATLSNTTGDTPVTSDTIKFVQPEVEEPGGASRYRADLPAGYRQMEKLVSTGNQRIATKIVPTATTTVEFEFGECLSKGTMSLIFGQEWGNPRYMLDTQSGFADFCYHGAGNSLTTGDLDLGVPIVAADDYRVTMALRPGDPGYADLTLKDVTAGNEVTTRVDLGLASGKVWHFFGAPNNGSVYSKYSFYLFKSSDNGVLTGDFVPVLRTSDSKAGLYDFVSKEFYTTDVGTAFVQQDFEQPPLALLLQNGRLSIALPPSEGPRTVRLHAGETYGGVDDWGDAVAVSNVAAGVTAVGFDKPAGWGTDVFFVRVQVDDGSDALWSNTLIWQPAAPLGVEKPTYVSSEFGSAVVAAQVTGIGKTAASATLTFAYGTTEDCADGTVTVENVTGAGIWTATLPLLQSGKTYYVKATLSNTTGDTSVTSEVRPFVQPKVAEPGVPLGCRGLPDGYVQMKKLTSTGNQRIDTEIVPTTTTTVEFEFGECLTKATHALYFGQEWGDPRYMLDTQNGNNNFCFHGTGTHNLQMPIDAADDYRLTTKLIPVQAGTANVIIEDLTKGTATTNVSDLGVASGVVWRFFGAPGRTDRNSKYSFYSFKSWDGGALTGDFVPVWSKAEEKAGLYDFVSKKFYTTQTGTAFARQEDVEQPLPPELVDGRLLATFPASVADRTAVLCSGATYGGTNGWTTTSDAVTIDAGETTASFDLPEGWGETVWYARVKIVEGDQETWSETLIAADANLPAVTLDSLDGLGGDTMIVKGTVDSLGGASCTLKVLTGTREDAITEEWTGLEGMTVTETGDFEFSLFENDTSASRYLTPGETYFVRVVATAANGKVAWSSVKSVTMANAAVFKSTSVSYSKRVMTVTAQMAEVGIRGTVDVELWVGVDAASLAKVAGPVTVTRANENFTLSYELPLYETSYVWQLKAVNVTTGGTASPVTPTASSTATAPDSTTYKWTGAGADNSWTNSANWSDDKSGDCLGYPQTVNATAQFVSDADVEIDLPRSGTTVNVGSLNLGTADIDVRFHSADTNSFGLVLNGLTVPGQRSRWTLDHAYVYRAADQNWSAYSTIVLTNSAYLYINNNNMANAVGVTMILADESYLSCYTVYLGNGSTNIINNSTFYTRYDDNLGNKAGEALVRFEGTHPLWWHNNKDRYFYSGLATTAMHFDFLVPEEGYDAAPIQCVVNQTKLAGNNNNNSAGAGKLTVNVLPDSPAARVDGNYEVDLISWAKGINKSAIDEGTLPVEVSGAAFVWSEEENPQTLSARFVGSAHSDRITVANEPADVPGDGEGFSPKCGDIDGETSVALAAPATFEFANGLRRATCTGWKLYDVDPATQEPGAEPVESGAENEYAWTNAGKWQKLVWQWRVEEKVVVTPVAGGTVTATSDWAGEGTPPTLTATPDTGKMFAGWTGDVTGAEQFENPLQLVDNGSPRTLAATFIAGTTPTATNSIADLDFSGFAHHTYITFDGYDGAAPIKDFPALIRLSEGKGGFSYADCAQANGGDVRFTLGDGRELGSEVVTWNVNGTSEIWVDVPELTKDARILMFWGNASAPARPLELKPFSSGYKLVYEMDATGATMQDSSLSGAHGFVTPTVTSVPGVVGMACSFDKSKSERVAMPRPSVRDALRPNTVGTWELWFKCPEGSATMSILSLDYGSRNNALVFSVNGSGQPGVGVFYGNNISADVPLGVWHHLMAEFDSVNGALRFYVDGALWGEKAPKGWFSGELNFYLAYSNDQNWRTYYTGLIDEVRVSTGLRGGDYPRAVYRNVMANDEFMTFESDPESRLEFKVADRDLDDSSESCRHLPTSTAHVFADGVEVAADAVPATAKQVVKRVGVVRQYRVTVAAGAGGTVEPALDGAWVDDGTILDVTATVTDESKAFHSWGGNCPTLEVFSASMKLPVDRARMIGAVFAPCTVITGGTDDETAQAAGAAVAQAVAGAAADAPSVVLLGEGLYQLPSGSSPCVSVAKPVVFRSADGVGKAVIDCKPNVNKIPLQLNHVGAAVDGLAFTDARSAGGNVWGRFLAVPNGHVQNCVFEDNGGSYLGSLLELAQNVNSACWAKGCVFRNNKMLLVHANGGLVDSCVFTNNVGSSDSALSAGNATVRNSLFAGNSASSNGGAFYSSGNAVVENCTFMDNYSEGQGGAVWGEALLVNCAFGGNSVKQASNGADWYDSTVTRLLGSLSPNFRSDELVGGNKVGQPVVRDKAAGDYRPTGVSPTRDHGFYTPSGYALGATDLSGAPRLYNRLVDSGCYEYTPGEQEEFAVNVTADVQNGVDELVVTFTSLVTGADDVSYAWNFGDGGTSTEANPVHAYTRVGYFDVTLTVTDNETGKTIEFAGGEKMITVLPSVCYVRTAGASTPEKPYATPATAADNIYDAFLIGPAVIDIGEGEINPGAAISIEHPITLRGKGPDKTFVNMTGGRSLTLENAGVVLADLTAYNLQVGHNLSMVTVKSLALVTNCVFRNYSSPGKPMVESYSGRLVDSVFCNSSNGSEPAGVRVHGSDSEVVNCVITNCTIRSASAKGVGVMVTDVPAGDKAPLIRNTLIADNRNTCKNEASTAAGIGLYLNGPAVVENCTIADNVTDYGTNAGVYVASANVRIVNTIASGNFIGTVEEHKPADFDALDTVTDCEPDHSFLSGDARFNCGARKSEPYWGLRGTSPCKNKGVKLDWMTPEAKDLGGQKRVFNAKPDIGCYESQVGGTVIIVR